MNGRIEGQLIGSLLADAYSLGAHWIYDVERIDSLYGIPQELTSPQPDSFHPSKQAGDQSPYGDQILWLIDSIKASEGFVLEDFSEFWKKSMEGYSGYRDHASKVTLGNLEKRISPDKAGSTSTDFSAAARIAPLVAKYHESLEELVSSARAQASFTHNSPSVIDAAEFFARVVHRVLGGERPTKAMETVLDQHDLTKQVQDLIRAGLHHETYSVRQAVSDFGQACGISGALPSVVYIIKEHEGSYLHAIEQNLLAGGDTCARGLAIGMVLGAFHGASALPDQWLNDLKSRNMIVGFLDDLRTT